MQCAARMGPSHKSSKDRTAKCYVSRSQMAMDQSFLHKRGGRARTKDLKDESGQVVVLLAICMAVLLGFVALATDAGVMFHAKREAQMAADAAAIAGAQQLNFGDVTSAAQTDATRNGFTDGSDGVTVQVENPPLNGPSAGNANYVEVTVSKAQPTYFMRLFGVKSLTVAARGVATALPENNCFHALTPTGVGIDVVGTANIQSPKCVFYANSTSTDGIKIAGNSTLNAAGESVVGNYAIDGNPSVAVTPQSGALPIPDPLAYLKAPTISGCGSAHKTSTLSPGCYNGLSITKGTVSLDPGVYVINGALKLTGQATLTGTDVTIYLTSAGSVSVEGQATLDLTAPTSGTYNGILFYQDAGNSSTAKFAGGSDSTLTGILYFPDAQVELVGGTSSSSSVSVIASSMKFAGNDSMNNYADANSSTPLRRPVLVE